MQPQAINIKLLLPCVDCRRAFPDSPPSPTAIGTLRVPHALCLKDKHEKEDRLHNPDLANGGKVYDSDDQEVAKDLRSQADRLEKEVTVKRSTNYAFFLVGDTYFTYLPLFATGGTCEEADLVYVGAFEKLGRRR